MDETFFYVMLMGFVPVEVAERNVNVNNERGENIADFFFSFCILIFWSISPSRRDGKKKKKKQRKGRHIPINKEYKKTPKRRWKQRCKERGRQG